MDKRYIRIDGKPLLMVYNPKEIPEYEKTINDWRKTAKEIGIGEIYIMSENDVGYNNFTNEDFVDAEFDFAPHGFTNDLYKISSEVSNKIFDYKMMVDLITKYIYKDFFPFKPFYFSTTMGWDNSPIQSALKIDSVDKLNQEENAFKILDDSFKKIIVIKDDIYKYYDENGVLIVGLKEFLLDESILEN